MVKSHYSQLFLLAKAHHTKIWRFLDAVRSDQNYNEQVQDQLEDGHTKIRQPQSNTYELTKTAIKASFPTNIFYGGVSDFSCKYTHGTSTVGGRGKRRYELPFVLI